MDNDPTKYNLKIMRISRKKTTNASVYRIHFLEILNSFPDATLCFTDGSKIGNRTGFAYSINNKTFSYRYRNSASFLTFDFRLSFQCLEPILSLPYSTPHTFLIASDSLTAQTTISNNHSPHPTASRMHTLLTTCSLLSQSVTFIWVPSNRRIPGNEIVDSTAKAPTILPRINSRILSTKSDLTLFDSTSPNTGFNCQNQTPSNKRARIKPLPFSWPSSHQTLRWHEIHLTRLRIGHAHLTHAHLLSNLFPLSCEHSKLDSPLTVSHSLRAPPSHLSVTSTESINPAK